MLGVEVDRDDGVDGEAAGVTPDSLAIESREGDEVRAGACPLELPSSSSSSSSPSSSSPLGLADLDDHMVYTILGNLNHVELNRCMIAG